MSQDLPQRKPNRIPNYDYSQGGAYYVTVCTQDRRQFLSRIMGDGAQIAMLPYGNALEKYINNAPEVTKYVIMPDHFHMIIEFDI